MSIAVGAVEDTLRRAINELEEISEATVDVLKETAASPGDTHVRATISTYEKTNFRDVMERVRSVLKQRWDEIIDEQDEKPYFEIVMGAVSDETPSGSIGEGDRQTTSDGRDTEPYLSDPNEFSGPEPPDEEEKTSSDDR